MNCDDFKTLRTDLLYRELSPDETTACREHLAGCAACHAEFEPIARLRGHLATLPEPNVNLDLSRLLTRVLAEQRRTKRRWAWGAALAAAAGLIIAVLLPLHWELAGDHLLVRWQPPPVRRPALRGDPHAVPAQPDDRPGGGMGYLALRDRLLSGGEIAGPAGQSVSPGGPLLYREWRRGLPALERAL